MDLGVFIVNIVFVVILIVLAAILVLVVVIDMDSGVQRMPYLSFDYCKNSSIRRV